jgi:outer membrane immunogenic protein
VKNTIAAAAALWLAAARASSAADLAPTAPPAVGAEIFSWSGFYFGLHAGYGSGTTPWTQRGFVEFPAFIVSNQNPKPAGALGGVQAGANYQVASWVFGVEADVSIMHVKGSDDALLIEPDAVNAITTATSQLEWLALFTGRTGYAWDRALFYVKGGVAAGRTTDNLVFTQTVAATELLDFGTKDNIQVGGTIGAGIEYALAPHWSTKVEYDYVDLGKTSEHFGLFTGAASLTIREDIEHRFHIVKVGANYRL